MVLYYSCDSCALCSRIIRGITAWKAGILRENSCWVVSLRERDEVELSAVLWSLWVHQCNSRVSIFFIVGQIVARQRLPPYWHTVLKTNGFLKTGVILIITAHFLLLEKPHLMRYKSTNIFHHILIHSGAKSSKRKQW